MYTKYFGFNEKPFTLTPNPRFIYLSNNHKEAFAHLLYGINNHYGFIELIGEVGTGKTTVLRTLLSQLHEDNYRTALIFNSCNTGVELLRSINHEFGLNATSEYANDLLAEFNTFLLSETSQGRTVVLVIDESQNLQPEILEQIRLISNLETENDKLIQIVLAGQPELGDLLERTELRQLNQRIAVRYRLKSMSMFETRAYIRHRMEVAGETGGVSFTLFAIRCIYLYTRGVPRMINILCDRSLLIAYGDERRRITAGIVTRAIRELLNISQGRQLSMAVIALACITTIGIAVSTSFQNWMPGARSHQQVSAPAVAASVASAVATPAVLPVSKTELSEGVSTSVAQKRLRLQQEILSYDQDDVHLLAFNAIADAWGANPIKMFSGRLSVPTIFSRLAIKRNLRITAFKGTLDQAIRFDLPFLVSTNVLDEGQAPYCIAVTAVNNDLISISPALFDSGTLSKSELNAIASGTFYLVWQNPGQIPDKIKLGDKRFEIRALQLLLQQAGTYKDAVDSNFSIATAKAVTDFQRAAGIKQDQSVGEMTLAALAKYNQNLRVPFLSTAGRSK